MRWIARRFNRDPGEIEARWDLAKIRSRKYLK
jgi:hypothetical protein